MQFIIQNPTMKRYKNNFSKKYKRLSKAAVKMMLKNSCQKILIAT